MNYYALFYYVVDDYVTRRSPFREEHLRLARESLERGELQLGGALGDPVDGALLVFRAPNKGIVEKFVHSDPYVRNSLVTRWEIRLWAVVVGDDK
jgi:uncharacterized protein YciI